MIFVLFPIKLWFFKNKFFIEQRRHLKHISDGEYMRDKISCLRSYFDNFSTLLQLLGRLPDRLPDRLLERLPDRLLHTLNDRLAYKLL